MVPVILYGDDNDMETAKLIARCLSKYAGVLHINSRCINYIGKNAKFLLLECQNPVTLNFKKGIIILKNKTKRIKSINIPDGFQVVTESDNKSALKLLKKVDHPIITCGMSVRDTLSVSSCKEDTVSISLQRNITLLSGEILECCEVPFKLSVKSDDYAKLAVAAILMLSGEVKAE